MRDLIILALVLGSLPLILARAWTGVLVWYWVGLMNPHRLAWGPVYDMPIAMLVGATTLLALLITRERRLPPLAPETVLIVVLAGWFTLTTAYAWVPSEAWAQWDKVMKILLMTLVGTMLIYGRRRTELLIVVVVLSVAFFGFKGGLFAVLTGGNYRVWGPTGSFLADNTSLGLALIMVAPLLLVLARRTRAGELALWLPHRWVGLGLYTTYWLGFAAIVFTYSRGALLGLAAVAPFLFLRMRGKSVLIALGVIGASVMYAVLPEQLVERAATIQTYQEDHSAMQRIQAWGVSWNVAREHFLGAGFSMAAMPNERWLSYANFLGEWYNEARAAHSIYFQVIGHHGFVGFALFMALIVFTLLSLWRLERAARGREDTRWMADYAWALRIGLYGFLAAGAFLDLAYFDLFYAYVAITVILKREWQSARASATALATPAPSVAAPVTVR